MADGLDFAVDFGAHAMEAEVGVDGEGEVEDGGVSGQLDHLPLGGEEVYLLDVEGVFEFLNEVEGALFGILEGAAYLLEPYLDGAVLDVFLGVRLFVEEVGGHAFLGDEVHALGAYLHLHPLADGGHDGGLKRLVAVGFGGGNPVAEAGGVGRESGRDK